MYQFVKLSLEPFPLLLLATGVALAALWRHRRETRGRLLRPTALWIVFASLALQPVSYMALTTLERGFDYGTGRPEGTEAIVVLAGGGEYLDATRRDAQLDIDSLVRSVHAARIYHAGPPCPVIVSGGRPQGYDAPLVAPMMAEFLRRLGVRDEDLVIESGSHTTYESACEVRPLLVARGVRRPALVTEAFHMRRALACYRKQGIDVAPSICRQQRGLPRHLLYYVLPSPIYAGQCNHVAQEWLGMLWYWVRGRI